MGVTEDRRVPSKRSFDDELSVLPALLSPQQLAGFLQIPVKTLYQWHYLGTGPAALRIGRHLRYRRSSVARWLALVGEGR